MKERLRKEFESIDYKTVISRPIGIKKAFGHVPKNDLERLWFRLNLRAKLYLDKKEKAKTLGDRIQYGAKIRALKEVIHDIDEMRGRNGR